MKVCSKCKVTKSNSSFGKNKRSKDGLQYECKECRREYNRQYNLRKHLERERLDSLLVEGRLPDELVGVEHYERIFRALESDVDQPVRYLLEFLRDSTPSGDHRDKIRPSQKQIAYLLDLGNDMHEFTFEEDKKDFLSVVGKLSMVQVGHLIGKLKDRRKKLWEFNIYTEEDF